MNTGRPAAPKDARSKASRAAERKQLELVAAAATMYEYAKIELPKLEKEKDKNKQVLVDWLGDETAKSLPDGRVISKSTADVPAASIEQRAYTTTTVYIQHAAAAAPTVPEPKRLARVG